MKSDRRQEDFEDEEEIDDSLGEKDEKRNIFKNRKRGLSPMTLSRREILRKMQREKRRGQTSTHALEILRNENERPTNRTQCKDGERPCPWVSCRHHLFLDVDPRIGSLKLNFPDALLKEEGHRIMPETCSLDVADTHPEGLTLNEVGELLNLTRERVRQLEDDIYKKLIERGNNGSSEPPQTAYDLFENLVYRLPHLSGNGKRNIGDRINTASKKGRDKEDPDFSLDGEFDE